MPEMSNLIYLLSSSTIFLVLLRGSSVNCERILVIGHSPSYSHHIVYRSLSRLLNERGHEVVFVTPIPSKDPSSVNYTEIDVSIMYKAIENEKVLAVIRNYSSFTKYEVDEIVYSFNSRCMDYFYKHAEVKRLYASGSKEKFDLIISESLQGLGFFALAHVLKAPLIAVSTTDLHMYHDYLLGAPILPSHPSNWELHSFLQPDTSFRARVCNYLYSLLHLNHWYRYQTKIQERIVRSYLGEDIPPLYDIAKNMSLLLVNYDPLIGYIKPLPPNVVLFSGLHIEDKPPPLSDELSAFLGNATDGFIYMSLGCNMKSSILPPQVVEAIYNVFSKLPYKVVWKYEANNLPKGNGNIFTSKWLPQQAILAHPNVKLFILQGGTQSTEETIHYSVPIIGVPVMFEQAYRIRKLVSLGVGRMLDIAEINEETFREAIYDVIDNKSYKAKMVELARLMKDKPYNNKAQVVWWMEYVMRHKGAPHLRFNGADDPWYQRYDMDVVVFLSVILFIVTVICVMVLVRTSRWLYKHSDTLSRGFSEIPGKGKLE